MKIIRKVFSAILGFFARIAVSFNKIFNKGDVSSNPAGKGTGFAAVETDSSCKLLCFPETDSDKGLPF